MGSALPAGSVLLGQDPQFFKYKGNDGDIKLIRSYANIIDFAGPGNTEPTGPVDDRDGARGPNSSKKKIGERVRFAIWKGKITESGANGSVSRVVTVKQPILDPAKVGVAPFTEGNAITGEVLTILNTNGTPTLARRVTQFTLSRFSEEANR